MFDYILDFSAPPPPPAHKISNNILIYLLLTGYCNWCPLPVIKIVKYCDVWGGGGGALEGAKILQKLIVPPLQSVLKIVEYCAVVGGGGICGAKILQTYWRPLSVIKIVKYCGVWEGEGALGGAKILQKIMAPPLSAIKIAKYCGVVGGGSIGGAKILQT